MLFFTPTGITYGIPTAVPPATILDNVPSRSKTTSFMLPISYIHKSKYLNPYTNTANKNTQYKKIDKNQKTIYTYV